MEFSLVNSKAYVATCHGRCGMTSPQFADERHGLQLWRVTADTLNKPLTADKICSFSFGVGRVTNNI
jgi:hypothetical protein